jgi:hypothetical protein
MIRDGEKFCDVCEEQIQAVETTRIAHRGYSYDVDLCRDHVVKLDRVLDQFISAGRRVDAANSPVS